MDRGAMLALVKDVWADTLGVDAIGDDDDFFFLGGHSLLVVKVADELEAKTGMRVPLRALFDEPTPAATADTLVGLGDSHRANQG
jgi:acyl carrier protein